MGKASFRKRLAREQREAMKSLQTSVAAQGLELEAWRPRRTGGKISEKLIDLFQDEINGDTDLQAAKGLILMAAIAWNRPSSPRSQEEMRRTLFAALPPKAQTPAQAHLEQMKQRRSRSSRRIGASSCRQMRTCRATASSISRPLLRTMRTARGARSQPIGPGERAP